MARVVKDKAYIELLESDRKVFKTANQELTVEKGKLKAETETLKAEALLDQQQIADTEGALREAIDSKRRTEQRRRDNNAAAIANESALRLELQAAKRRWWHWGSKE